MVPLRWVLIRDPEGVFATQALLCTEPHSTPEQIVAWFVQRWQLEVTFEAVRRHLGVETQRQWSDLAILRTTPALLGLVSLVTLFAQQHGAGPAASSRQAAWYPKALPTFVDALALLRRELWAHQTFSLSGPTPDLLQVPRQFVEHLTQTLCYAA